MEIKSNVNNTNDEIEVLHRPGDSYARVRIRERGTTWSAKASVFLDPDQLKDLAQGCLAIAKLVREQIR